VLKFKMETICATFIASMLVLIKHILFNIHHLLIHDLINHMSILLVYYYGRLNYHFTR